MQKTITYRHGATTLEKKRFSIQRGEALDLTVVVLTSTGAAANLTGYHVVLELDVDPTTGHPDTTSLAGDNTGSCLFHVHGPTTTQWPDLMQFQVWLSLDSNPDDPVPLVEKSSIVVKTVVAVPVPIRIYYGAAAAGLTETSAIEAALSHVDTESGSFNFTVAPSNQKLYYAAPVSWGIASAAYNGTSFVELTPRTESLHDQHGDVIPYYLHESAALYTGV
jgi:hypothetical protein